MTDVQIMDGVVYGADFSAALTVPELLQAARDDQAKEFPDLPQGGRRVSENAAEATTNFAQAAQWGAGGMVVPAATVTAHRTEL